MTAFLFPGQLSEYEGMGRDFHDASPHARELFKETSQRCGVDLATALFHSPLDQIRENRIAQPAVFLVSTLAARELTRRGVLASAVAGYSLGSYAALVHAGAISYEDALAVLLAALSETDRLGISGAMGFVIGVPVSRGEEVCARLRELGRRVWIGNVNAATQLVLTGSRDGVEAAIADLSAQALKAGLLPMTWGIHSPLMEEVSNGLASTVDSCRSIRAPRVPTYSAHRAAPIETESQVRDLLIRQIALPSRWKETVERMSADGHRRFLEVGPGDTLTRMLRWIVREGECRPAGTLAMIDAAAALEENA